MAATKKRKGQGQAERETTACVCIAERRGTGTPGIVSINDTRYGYRTIAGRSIGVKQVVRLVKDGGVEVYEVSLLSNGRIECTCGDFTFRKAYVEQDRHRCEEHDGLCKHGRGLRKADVLDDGVRWNPEA